MSRHLVDVAVAEQIWDWIQNRDGILIWESVNLSNPGGSWTTPALNSRGAPVLKPTWQSASSPARHIKSADDILVVTWRELKRFYVAIELHGVVSPRFDVTAGGSRRIRKAISKAAEKHTVTFEGDTVEPTHGFDYETQSAIILVPDRVETLSAWRERTKQDTPPDESAT